MNSLICMFINTTDRFPSIYAKKNLELKMIFTCIQTSYIIIHFAKNKQIALFTQNDVIGEIHWHFMLVINICIKKSSGFLLQYWEVNKISFVETLECYGIYCTTIFEYRKLRSWLYNPGITIKKADGKLINLSLPVDQVV